MMSESTTTADKLIAIPSFELKPNEALPFDLFVRLPVTNRVILFRRTGSSLDQEKVDRVSSQQLRFFVQKNDYEKYLDFATREFQILLSRVPPEPGALRNVAGQMLSSTLVQASPGETRELLGNMGNLVEHFVNQVAYEGAEARRTLFTKFSKLANTGTDFQRHPVHVASLTVMISVGLGISDQRTLVEIGLAGLLHDIGLTQLPMSVIPDAHRFHELGVVSKALLKLHPSGSVDLLRQRGVVTSKLMEAIILQHHEQYNGGGYPLGLAGAKVHPLAQVLRVADDLDDLLVRDGSTDLESRVKRLFERYEMDKTIDPSLATKIRDLLFME